jgi:hypothetical protein
MWQESFYFMSGIRKLEKNYLTVSESLLKTQFFGIVRKKWKLRWGKKQTLYWIDSMIDT